MFCPFCEAEDTKVIDSRLVADGSEVRRRRECIRCEERFTTYEVAELMLPKIVKRDGRRTPFDEEKLRAGMIRSLQKRPVSTEQIEASVNRIKHRLQTTGEREVDSNFVGEAVMDELRMLDPVAYVRFASIYRSFEDVDAFRKEIQRLQDSPNKVK